MNSPLDHLHTTLIQSLHNKSYLDLNPVQNVLKESPTKNIRPYLIFQTACKIINEYLKTSKAKDEDLKNEISHLKLLELDGVAYYQKYLKATQTWSRIFLKSLAFLTPEFLKRFLPSCFSNQMAQAEFDTRNEYENYSKCLKKHIENLSKKMEKQDKEEILPKDSIWNPAQEGYLPSLAQQKSCATKYSPKKIPKIDSMKQTQLEQIKEDSIAKDLSLELAEMNKIELGTGENPSSEAPSVTGDDAVWLDHTLAGIGDHIGGVDDTIAGIDDTIPAKKDDSGSVEKDKFQHLLFETIETLAHLIQSISQFEEHPLSLNKYKQHLRRMIHEVDILNRLEKYSIPPLSDSEKMAALEKNRLLISQQKMMEFHTLEHPEFQEALDKNNHKDILSFLEKQESWHTSFQQALQKEGHHIEFGVAVLPGKTKTKILKFKNEKNKPVKEAGLQDYRGEIWLSIPSDPAKALSLTIEFMQFLQKNPACKPCTIKVTFEKESVLNAELFIHLQKMSQEIAEIQIQGIKQVNLKDLGLTAEDERAFVQNIHQFNFVDAEEIILTDNPKTGWTTSNFSNLLSACPTMKMLKTCYQLAPHYEYIHLPKELLDEVSKSELDLREFALEQLSTLLEFFKSKSVNVNLSGQKITDSLLTSWIQDKSFFSHVESLNIEGCTHLTTDVLQALTTLPKLTQLVLPDLPAGKASLSKLPILDNPFKINLFYTTSKQTQLFANRLYNGPILWAPAFQIPLARKGITEIFSPKQRFLDPKSVAYWLYHGDFEKLSPKNNIHTILAESNPYLTDSNLVSFLQKFPSAQFVSLSNCPKITDEGVLSLLENCPWIRILDITGMGISVDTVKALKKKLGDQNVFASTLGTPTQKPEMIDITQEQRKNCYIYYNLLNEISECQKKIKTLQQKEPTSTEITLLTQKLADLTQQSAQLKSHFMHDRIVAELFFKDIEFHLPMMNIKEFSDFELNFQIDKESQPQKFLVHRDMLSSQAEYFRERFKPGGELNLLTESTILSVHAMPEVAQRVIDLFYGKLSFDNLSGETAAKVAEIIGPKSFNFFEPHYSSLLQYIHGHFHVDLPQKTLDDLLLTAKKLDDHEGMQKYENQLLSCLEKLTLTQIYSEEEAGEMFTKISTLSKIYPSHLSKLKAKVDQMEKLKNEDIENAQLQENHFKSEKLTKEAIAAGII